VQFLAMNHGLAGAADTDAVNRLRVSNFARIWELYVEGTIRQLYQRGDNPWAVFLLECDSVEQAREKLSTIPFTQHGITAWDVIPLQPFIGFAQLFASPLPSGS
jgi:muconolactone delta-isomerase